MKISISTLKHLMRIKKLFSKGQLAFWCVIPCRELLNETKACLDSYEDGTLNMTGCGAFQTMNKLIFSPNISWHLLNMSCTGNRVL